MNTAHLHLADGRRVDYLIQTSARARCVRMKLSAQQGLVVVKPATTPHHYVTEWVNSKAAWIAKHWQPQVIAPATPQDLPERIELLALGETFQVIYQAEASNGVTLRIEPERVLRISGLIEEHTLCHQVLRRWLQRYAKQRLGEWLTQLTQETGLSYQGYSVKGQRSRWGSCSNQGNINLNYKLLLLPPAWARYTMIHELCHTVELNHSKRFWALVTQFAPDYPEIHHAMRGAMAELPHWVQVD